MELCPFYDPNHKCGIVREHVFKDCLAELRERERLALAKLLQAESKLQDAIKALTICDGSMIGKVKPSSVAFKLTRSILYPDNA